MGKLISGIYTSTAISAKAARKQAKRDRRERLRISRTQKSAPYKYKFATAMRLAPTGLETILYTITERALSALNYGLTIQRQAVQRGYILDAYIPEIHLALEADGPIHESRAHYDRLRDWHLHRAGISTLHFTEHQLQQQPGLVETLIRRAIKSKNGNRKHHRRHH
jgi:very-short-patch-repair endonuclease